jgi:hypothetical protein
MISVNIPCESIDLNQPHHNFPDTKSPSLAVVTDSHSLSGMGQMGTFTKRLLFCSNGRRDVDGMKIVFQVSRIINEGSYVNGRHTSAIEQL